MGTYLPTLHNHSFPLIESFYGYLGFTDICFYKAPNALNDLKAKLKGTSKSRFISQISLNSNPSCPTSGFEVTILLRGVGILGILIIPTLHKPFKALLTLDSPGLFKSKKSAKPADKKEEAAKPTESTTTNGPAPTETTPAEPTPAAARK